MTTIPSYCIDLPTALPSGTLAARTVAVDALTLADRDAMWRLFAAHYESLNFGAFCSDLSAKDRVILLADSGDGTLQGFSTLQVIDGECEGRRFSALFSGDTIIARGYWGQAALHRAMMAEMARLKLRRPLQPAFWFLISKGFKTYLLLARNFARSWPHRGRAMPAWEAAVLAKLAREKFGDDYDAGRGVVSFAECKGRLQAQVAPVDEAALAKPDVRFFVERNPGHAAGDELCCLGAIDAALLWGLARKYILGVRS